MEVTVRELKNRLSEFLRRAQAGEEILVTSHGRRIVRMTGIVPAVGEAEAEAIARLRASPWVRAGDGRRVTPVMCPIRPAAPGEPLLSDLVLADRD